MTPSSIVDSATMGYISMGVACVLLVLVLVLLGMTGVGYMDIPDVGDDWLVVLDGVGVDVDGCYCCYYCTVVVVMVVC